MQEVDGNGDGVIDFQDWMAIGIELSRSGRLLVHSFGLSNSLGTSYRPKWKLKALD